MLCVKYFFFDTEDRNSAQAACDFCVDVAVCIIMPSQSQSVVCGRKGETRGDYITHLRLIRGLRQAE